MMGIIAERQIEFYTGDGHHASIHAYMMSHDTIVRKFEGDRASTAAGGL